MATTTIALRLAEQTFRVEAAMVRYFPPLGLNPVQWGLLHVNRAEGDIPYLRASLNSTSSKLVPNGSSRWGWPVEEVRK